jgi:hypothetical protein
MDIEINEVQEIIKNLERGGELSIKEEKYLKVAKLCVQLAAENVELKEDRDTLARYWIEDGGDKDCAMSYCEPTPATDLIGAGIKADAIDEAAVELDRVDTVASTRVIGFKLREFAKQLREGADK